ncbi:MAG TPA: hypothetical protein VMS60_11325 [Solirubrobacterales bacterium]|nr:hypothetical protein [Solirubrobacterales bacterium]
MMKGVTLAGGGLALVNLASNDFPVPRIALVVVAFIGVVLTYYGQSVGLIIVHLRPSILDIALPMSLTVVELYIIYRPGAKAGGDFPIDWFGGLALWALLAACVVASVARRLNQENYSSALWPIVKAYRSELQGDVAAACALAVGTAVFVIVLHDRLEDGTALPYGFLAAATIVLGSGIRSQGITRRKLAEKLGMAV